MLETLTTAIVCLFQAQSALLDQVPSLGYIPRVFAAMNSKNNAIPKSAVQVCHQLAYNEVSRISSSSAVYHHIIRLFYHFHHVYHHK